MKLTETLSEYSIPKLANLIQKWGGRVPRSISQKELTEQLFSLMQNPAKLEKVIFSLIPGERTFLGAVLVCNGNVDYSELSEFANKSDHAYSFSYYISDLQSTGLLVVKYGKKTANIFIPEELKAPLKKLLIEFRPVPENKESEELMLASPIIDDIFRICVFSKNMDGIRVTQQGRIFKKVKQHLLETLGKNSEDRLEYAVSIMINCKLLEINKKTKSLHPLDENAIRTIFSKPREKTTIYLIAKIIAMQRLNKKFLTQFLDILNQERSEYWFDYRDFIKNRRNDFFEEKDVKGWLEFDLYMLDKLIFNLNYLGILDIKYSRGHNGANIHSFKISTFGLRVLESSDANQNIVHNTENTEKPFIVSPNFEVNVFAEKTDYYTMYRLGRIAQMLRFDTVSTFRLEKEHVLRALEEGYELAKIISFLEQNSKKELPQNVRYSLSDWGSKYGKVTAGKGYIEIIDRSVYERVEQIMSPYIIRSINNPVILFDEKNTDEVTSRLRKADIFPSNIKKIIEEQE